MVRERKPQLGHIGKQVVIARDATPRIGRSGVFSTRLPAGAYAVSGASGLDRSAPTTARVRAGETSRILVVVVAS